MTPVRSALVPALLSVLAAGCIQDPTTVAPEIPVPSSKGVYITNEGNFGRGNASLSYYDLESFRVYDNVFTAVNGKSLGDVAAGMYLRGNRGYIIVNNSQKIEVIDLGRNVNVGTIPTGPGSSPRRMAFVNDTLALVTDLYSNSVLEVNLRTFTITGSIAVGPNPEGIALAAGKAYVGNSGFGSGNSVSVISLATMTVIRTLSVADGPAGVHITPAGFVYAICGGSYGDFNDPNDDTPAKAMVIDPVSDVVIDSMLIGGHAQDIAIGTDGIGYVAGATEVVRIDTRAHKITGTFITGTFYGLAVDAGSGDVYLSDPGSYVSPGTVSIYASNGVLRNRFQAGIIPGGFAFKK